MSKQIIFRSMKSVKKHYFPETYRKELINRMTPSELGIYWANEIMKKIKKRWSDEM